MKQLTESDLMEAYRLIQRAVELEKEARRLRDLAEVLNKAAAGPRVCPLPKSATLYAPRGNV